MSTDALFKPFKLGDIEAKNRFVMAPLTRCHATPRTHVPTPIMTEYYAQRASAGVIIAEATMIAADHSAFYAEPGIYNAEQVAAWKSITEAVHAKGGKIVLQIQHGGRAAITANGVHDDVSKNVAPVAPSAIALTQHQVNEPFNPTGTKVPYDAPRELKEEEIPVVIAQFVTAAKNAIAAGFDGVEIHGANGYLIDQFLRASANKRTGGRYSGASVETRAQFALDVTAAVAEAIGAGKTGIRLSPLNSFNEMADPEPEKLVRYVCAKLSEMHIGFVHMMRADFFGVQKGDAATWARESFKGTLVLNMGYQPEEAAATIDSGAADAVAFGTLFLANPDLPERVARKAPFNPPRMDKAYAPGPEGYTDYPALEPVAAATPAVAVPQPAVQPAAAAPAPTPAAAATKPVPALTPASKEGEKKGSWLCC